MNSTKYVVIGGQYFQRCYGVVDNLIAAKRLATKNEEYWDNWQGFHTPLVYDFRDCEELEDGRIIHKDVLKARYAIYSKENSKWRTYNV